MDFFFYCASSQESLGCLRYKLPHKCIHADTHTHTHTHTHTRTAPPPSASPPVITSIMIIIVDIYCAPSQESPAQGTYNTTNAYMQTHAHMHAHTHTHTHTYTHRCTNINGKVDRELDPFASFSWWGTDYCRCKISSFH